MAVPATVNVELLTKALAIKDPGNDVLPEASNKVAVRAWVLYPFQLPPPLY